MKISALLLLSLLIFSEISSQVEMSIEDINNDGDVEIEIIKKISAEHELRKMLIGVNQSSGGFLKVVSDHNLSFWTDNRRRLTIENNGSVGIGVTDPIAKLHVGAGDIIAQTQIRIIGNFGIPEARMSFYSGTDRIGGVLSRGTSIILENEDKGNIILRSNDTDHMIINSQGSLRLPSLSGEGHRNLSVSSNGTIEIEPLEDIHMMIPMTDFQAMFGLQLHNFFGLKIWAPPSIFNQNLDGLHVIPTFNHTKVFVKEITIFFIDDEDKRGLKFRIRIPNEDNIEEFSSDASPNIRSITIPLNVEVDQSQNENIQLIVFDAVKEELSITGAKLIYQKL